MYRLINTTNNTTVAFFPAEDHNNAAVLVQALVKGLRAWAKKHGQAIPKKGDFALRAPTQTSKHWSGAWNCDPRFPSSALRAARKAAIAAHKPMPQV